MISPDISCDKRVLLCTFSSFPAHAKGGHISLVLLFGSGSISPSGVLLLSASYFWQLSLGVCLKLEAIAPYCMREAREFPILSSRSSFSRKWANFGCHNKLPPYGQLKWQQCVLSWFWRPGIWDPDVNKAVVFQRCLWGLQMPSSPYGFSWSPSMYLHPHLFIRFRLD